MKCDCIKQVNEYLAKSNVALKTEIKVNRKTGKMREVLALELKPLNKKGKMRIMGMAYCPFCGQSQTEEEKAGE
jgi:acetone carboxylase gamma subunit